MSRPLSGLADTITVLTEAAAWNKALPEAARIARKTMKTALETVRPRRRRAFEVCLLLSSNRKVQTLNRTFRNKDKPTNVLSFPTNALNPEKRTVLLGDIVLAFGVVRDEARDSGKPLRHHFQHLVVHGLLHLLGYDHMNDHDADRMEALERRILGKLKIPDPYENT